MSFIMLSQIAFILLGITPSFNLGQVESNLQEASSIEKHGYIVCSCFGLNQRFKFQTKLLDEVFQNTRNAIVCDDNEATEVCEFINQCFDCSGEMQWCSPALKDISVSNCSRSFSSKKLLPHLKGYRSRVRSCLLPKLKSEAIICNRSSVFMDCTQKCFLGYTLKDGISSDRSCTHRENKWKPEGFQECQPFIDCTLNLTSPGRLDCFTATTTIPVQCNITCDKTESKYATQLRQYTCEVSGEWNPKLPFCAKSGQEPSNCKIGRRISSFHQKIFKCRELIFTESEIVATPDKFSTAGIVAVIPITRFYTPEFQKKLDTMELKVRKTDNASPIVLQECLQYTITAKMAPQWNIVQNLLVQGRDFLISSDPLRAVKLEVFVNANEVTLSVIPKCIKLPHFKLEKYAKLCESPEKIMPIQESCHVLPSFKKGNVISISKSSMTTNVFKNYADIKKHWKNMYGYRLPEISDEDIWYATVVFDPFPDSLTYPYFCVRPFDMTEVRRVDPQSTLHFFINDFCKKVGSICTQKCQILDRNASFPALQLYQAHDVTEDAIPRIGTTHKIIGTVPYRSSTVSRTNNEKSINKPQQGNDVTHIQSQISKNAGKKGINSPLENISQLSSKLSDQKHNSFSQGNISCNRSEKSVYTGVKSQDSLRGSFFTTDVKNLNDKSSRKLKKGENHCKTDLENVSSRVISNAVIKSCSEDSKGMQPKYAPIFFPKTPKNVPSFTLTDAFRKTKAAKPIPKFHAEKINNTSDRSPSKSDNIKKQNSNFKCNPDQLKMASSKGNVKTSAVISNCAPAKLNDFQQGAVKKLDEKHGSMKRSKERQDSLVSKSKKKKVGRQAIRKK